MIWRLALLAAVLTTSEAVARSAPAPDLAVIRDRLDQYLLAYEPRLSTLIADEDLWQDDTYRRRRIESEVAFIGLPGNAGWMGFRRVVRVANKPLAAAGPPLAQLLAGGAPTAFDQAKLLLEQSAQHNLGAPRTINLPNLPLELLHPRHRHRFALRFDMNERINGYQTVRFIAEEVSKPSIIQNPAVGDFPSLVTAWVEPGTGKLIRAQVVMRDTKVITGVQFQWVIWVDFKDDQALDMLVPKEMRERFFVEKRRTGNGIARYSNYRRFETSARIVPQ